MNIQEYISSGILEAYVLGELPQEEVLKVEKIASEHKEVRDEISNIEHTLEGLAFKAAVKPGDEVRQKIMQEVEQREQQGQHAKVVTMSSAPAKTGLLKYAVAASVTIALVSSFLAYSYWNKWKSAQLELNNLVAQNQRVAQDYNTVNQKLEQIEHDFEIVSDTSYRKIALPGTENAPQAFASIYWNTKSEEVYLSIQHLKELSSEQQYQLWAIIDGKPVDAGVFNVKDGLLKMKRIAGASAFAVTIEPKGGSSNPSLETMQVMGAVGS